jgi:nucleoside-diphosphate-sugar epimerase
MRILVTGARGFIGSQVIPLLLRAGHEVHAVSRDCSGQPVGVHAHVANILASDCRELLETIKPSHLLHLGWHVPPGNFWAGKENIDWLNASLTLFQSFAAAGGRRWVGAGTCAEYDWSRSGIFREPDPCFPASLYGACKCSLHMISGRLGEQLGIEVASGRVFFPYGPAEPAGRLVPSVIRSLLAGESIGCTGGLQVRDYVFIEDVAAAFVRLLETNICGPVNIGSGASITVGEVVVMIGEMIGRPELIQFGALPSRAREPHEIVADVSRLQSLGWMPSHSVRDGLERTIQWWRAGL